MMGCFQPGRRRGMRGMTMGSRNTVPPRMLRIVPLGESHTNEAELWSVVRQKLQVGCRKRSGTFL